MSLDVTEGARQILARSNCPPPTRSQIAVVSAIVFGLRVPERLPPTPRPPRTQSRPRRRMPTMPALAEHLGILGMPAHCARCGDVPGSGSWLRGHRLQRAHVIDRVFGGLDNAANLRPLCDPCHSRQPAFGPDDEAEALHWFEGA